MGKVFLEFIPGTRLFLCANCRIPLSSRDVMTSSDFVGSTGRAYLFSHVVNIIMSDVILRHMRTGQHYVRDVACKNCETPLGWMYEYAMDEPQKYKEGQVILEKRLISEIINLVDGAVYHHANVPQNVDAL